MSPRCSVPTTRWPVQSTASGDWNSMSVASRAKMNSRTAPPTNQPAPSNHFRTWASTTPSMGRPPAACQPDSRQPASRPTDSGATRSATWLEQYLDRAGAPRVLQGQHGVVPAFQREPVRDDRRQVETSGDEVEVVLHGVLGDAGDLLHAEPVRADDVQLLEIQRGPLDPLRRFHPRDDQGAPGREQPQRRLHGVRGEAPTRRATSATSSSGTDGSTACAPSLAASAARAPGRVAAHTSAAGYRYRTRAITANASVP